jgi:hypothetical protein
VKFNIGTLISIFFDVLQFWSKFDSMLIHPCDAVCVYFLICFHLTEDQDITLKYVVSNVFLPYFYLLTLYDILISLEHVLLSCL